MKLLAIDSSSLTCSVALSEDGILRALFSIQYKTTHSQILMPMLSDIRDKLSLDMDTLDAVAVSAGPGSFTGLRIGAATAKGLCLALGIPLVPVPTLEAMAYRLWGVKGLIVPIMDARRNQVYSAVYRSSGTDGQETAEILNARAVALPELLDDIKRIRQADEVVYFLGDAVPVHREYIDSTFGIEHSYAPFHLSSQSADAVAALAYRKLMTGYRGEDPDSFVPEYLRLSQAERQALGLEETPVKKDHTPLHIRTRLLLPEDMEEASKLEKKCLSGEAWTKAQLSDAAASSDTIYLAVVLEDMSDTAAEIIPSVNGEGAYREGDRLIGICGLKNVAGTGEITNVCVDPDYRRQGVGKKMLKQLIERSRGLDVTACTLEVRDGNTAACALYESLGFECEGVRPGFYSDPPEDARIYWLKRHDTEEVQ